MTHRVPWLLYRRRICLKESLRQLFLEILLWFRSGMCGSTECLCYSVDVDACIERVTSTTLSYRSSNAPLKWQSPQTCSNGRVPKLAQMAEFKSLLKWQSSKTRANGRFRKMARSPIVRFVRDLTLLILIECTSDHQRMTPMYYTKHWT